MVMMLMMMCLFAVYVDVRYETKGTFLPGVKYKIRSFREFIGYVIVAKYSIMELTVSEPLHHFIHVVVLSSFIFNFLHFEIIA